VVAAKGKKGTVLLFLSFSLLRITPDARGAWLAPAIATLNDAR